MSTVMFIAYQKQRGIEYARLMESVRVDGCVKKKSGPNLGRVLDKERGIYQSKERGIFTFDLKTNTYGKPPQSYVSNIRRKNAREKLIVDYGDAFLFDALLDKFGLRQALQSLGYGNPDSLGALLLYYILQKRSNLHASTWYEGSFARILYPKANLTSQRISDLLESIGKEDNMRAFFNAYLSVLKAKDEEKENAGILIDSTGLPNGIHFPLTAVSNHNGVISEEVRLIYVVQQSTRLPIYMRYVPGNIVDTTTLITTLKELKAHDVSTKFAILDAGYMTAEGVKHLYDDGISFITRCPTNRSIYKQALMAGLKDLEAPENVATDESGRLFNGRQVYIKCVPIESDGMKLYAYVGRDKSMQEQERQRAVSEQAHSKKPLNKQAFHEKMDEHGVFVLVSSRRIRADKLLSLYYVRQDIEQVFDVSKNYASLLPLNVEKEETFRGHLLMTFIATVLLQMLQNDIRQSPFSLDRILARMQTQKAKVYEHVVIPSEPVKEHNEIYKLLRIKPRKEHTVPADCIP